MILYLVKHPHDNETILIAGCELLVDLIPSNNLDLSTVAFQCLIHWQIRWGCQPFYLTISTCLQKRT